MNSSTAKKSKPFRLKVRDTYFRLRGPSLIREMNQIYYSGPEGKPLFETTTFLGVPILKCPLDLHIYQEVIYETQPDVIIECGVKYGGSTLYLASICDLMGKGKVLACDIT